MRRQVREASVGAVARGEVHPPHVQRPAVFGRNHNGSTGGAGGCGSTLLASPRSIPVAAAAAMAAFPALDLWVEATQYVERNAYAEYRIVGLEDVGRVLEVSGQGASRHDPEA